MENRDATGGSPPAGDESASTQATSAPGQTGRRMEQARATAGRVGQKVKQKTRQAAEEVRDQATAAAEQQKHRVAEELDTVAGALREAGRKLHEGQEERLAPYTDRAAEYLEGLAGYFRDQSLQDLIEDSADMARRHPGLFLGGAVVLGFALARFIKASGEEADEFEDYRYEPSERYAPSMSEPENEPDGWTSGSQSQPAQEGGSPISDEDVPGPPAL